MKLSDLIKKAVYDIVGYMLPGSTIFLIEFLNAFISSIVYAIYSYLSLNLYHAYEFKLINILFPIITPALFFFLFVACYIEFKEHERLQDKENFFYLLENFYQKEIQPSSTN